LPRVVLLGDVLRRLAAVAAVVVIVIRGVRQLPASMPSHITGAERQHECEPEPTRKRRKHHHLGQKCYRKSAAPAPSSPPKRTVWQPPDTAARDGAFLGISSYQEPTLHPRSPRSSYKRFPRPK